MTIGIRIQALRKKNKLSQEELANRLSVSRQTVSQWETDQTIPSIDNLYLLKEIFRVSFDEILSNEAPAADGAPPLESYTVSYDANDIKNANRAIYAKALKRYAIVIFVAALFCISIIVQSEISTATIGFLAGCMVLSILNVFKGILWIKKNEKQAIVKSTAKTYRYAVFETVLKVTVLENNEETKQYAIQKGVVETAWETARYFIFIYSGQLFILKKEWLAPDSRVAEFLPPSRDKEICSEQKDRSVLSTVLLLCSFASVFGALACAGWMGTPAHFIEYTWVFFLFTPVPAASVVYGVLQRRKGIKNKKNIVAGAILFALLCIYGSFSFLFAA